VADPQRGAPSSPAGRESNQILRAKYLDYCSAQVAEILLRLSPDEIFVLAREGAEDDERVRGLSYDALVQLATTRIYNQLELPVFEEWVKLYESDPERFEDEFLGFWEAETPISSDH
jgi:hypothetical protein